MPCDPEASCVLRHCEERSDEPIQTISAERYLDCFASLAMTAENPSPRRRALHRGLPFCIRGPQLQAASIVVGVDGELAAFEQRLHATVGEFLRRLSLVQL